MSGHEVLLETKSLHLPQHLEDAAQSLARAVAEETTVVSEEGEVNPEEEAIQLIIRHLDGSNAYGTLADLSGSQHQSAILFFGLIRDRVNSGYISMELAFWILERIVKMKFNEHGERWDPEEARKIIARALIYSAERIGLIKRPDPLKWAEAKDGWLEHYPRWHEDWPAFWNKWHVRIKLQDLVVPPFQPGFGFTIVVPKGITNQKALEIMLKTIGRDPVPDVRVYREQGINVEKFTSAREPAETYVVRARDLIFPDPELTELSPLDVERERIQCITFREWCILAAHYYDEARARRRSGLLDDHFNTMCLGSRLGTELVPYIHEGWLVRTIRRKTFGHGLGTRRVITAQEMK